MIGGFSLQFDAHDEVFENLGKVFSLSDIPSDEYDLMIPNGVESVICNGDDDKINENVRFIFIPSTVRILNSNFLVCCKNLESIVIDEKNKVFEMRNGMFINKKKHILQYSLPNILPQNFKVPSDIKEVWRNALVNQQQLDSVDFSPNVKTIEPEVFEEHDEIKKLVLSEKFEQIYDGFFEHLTNLECVEIAESNKKYFVENESVFEKGVGNYARLIFYFGKDDFYKIPDFVTSVSSYAFKKKVKKVEIPNFDIQFSIFNKFSDELSEQIKFFKSKQNKLVEINLAGMKGLLLNKFENSDVDFSFCNDSEKDKVLNRSGLWHASGYLCDKGFGVLALKASCESCNVFFFSPNLPNNEKSQKNTENLLEFCDRITNFSKKTVSEQISSFDDLRAFGVEHEFFVRIEKK